MFGKNVGSAHKSFAPPPHCGGSRLALGVTDRPTGATSFHGTIYSFCSSYVWWYSDFSCAFDCSMTHGTTYWLIDGISEYTVQLMYCLLHLHDFVDWCLWQTAVGEVGWTCCAQGEFHYNARLTLTYSVLNISKCRWRVLRSLVNRLRFSLFSVVRKCQTVGYGF